MTVRRPTTTKHAPHPPLHPEYELLGPWWTYDAPSLRVVDRRRVYVSIWSAGDAGPSVLLVPPAAADHRVWEPVLPALTEHLIVHALDLRGPDTAVDPDAGGVCTALAAVGAQLVVAYRDAARPVLGALDRMSPARTVLWDPPLDVVESSRLRDVAATVRVISARDDVLAAVAQMATVVGVHCPAAAMNDLSSHSAANALTGALLAGTDATVPRAIADDGSRSPPASSTNGTC